MPVRPGSLLDFEIRRHEYIAGWKRRLDTLAANLAFGAALCLSFYLAAIEAASSMKHGAHYDQWFPGCQRPAPGRGGVG